MADDIRLGGDGDAVGGDGLDRFQAPAKGIINDGQILGPFFPNESAQRLIRLGSGIIFNLNRDEVHYEAVFLPNPLEREQPLTHGSRSRFEGKGSRM